MALLLFGRLDKQHAVEGVEPALNDVSRIDNLDRFAAQAKPIEDVLKRPISQAGCSASLDPTEVGLPPESVGALELPFRCRCCGCVHGVVC